MLNRRVVQVGGVGVLMAAMGAMAVLMLGGAAAAPTTQGLILQAVTHAGSAASGNGSEAYLIVAAYNEAGPIRGIPAGSFSVAVVAGPAGADPIKRVGVTEPVSGIYKIAIAPELSSHRWTAGTYALSIGFTSPSGSGVVVGSLVIGG